MYRATRSHSLTNNLRLWNFITYPPLSRSLNSNHINPWRVREPRVVNSSGLRRRLFLNAIMYTNVNFIHEYVFQIWLVILRASHQLRLPSELNLHAEYFFKHWIESNRTEVSNRLWRDFAFALDCWLWCGATLIASRSLPGTRPTQSRTRTLTLGKYPLVQITYFFACYGNPKSMSEQIMHLPEVQEYVPRAVCIAGLKCCVWMPGVQSSGIMWTSVRHNAKLQHMLHRKSCMLCHLGIAGSKWRPTAPTCVFVC